MVKRFGVICLLALLLLAFAACGSGEKKAKVIAIEEIDDVVLIDGGVDLPYIKVTMSDGTTEPAEYASFWFSAEYVFVQSGRLLAKEDAPQEFADVLTVTLKDDINIKQTVNIEKPFIPLKSVDILGQGGKSYCIAGENLVLELVFKPANTSVKNINLITSFDNASVEDGILYLPNDFPDDEKIIVTAQSDGVAYGTTEIFSRKRIEISNAVQLADMADNPDGDYALTADIADFSGSVEHFPIPRFSGTLNGNGHTVFNFSLTVSDRNFDDEQNIGLFGILSGEVYNLSLADVNIDCGKYQGGAVVNVGAVAGKLIGGEVRGVSVSGRLRSERYLSRIGGIVGYAGGGLIDGCYVSAEILASGDVGGVAGYAQNSVIKDALINGGIIRLYAVIINGTVGGIVGSAVNSTINNATANGVLIKLEACENIAPSKVQLVIGILAGLLNSSNITDFSAIGSIVDSAIETDFLAGYNQGIEYTDQLVFVGSGQNKCYGKSINNSMVLTDKTSVTVHVYDGDSIRSDDSRYSGHRHTKEYAVGLDIDKLKEKGFRAVKVTMTFEIRAQNMGEGRSLWLDLDKRCIFKRSNINVDKMNWYKVTYTVTVSIDDISTASKFRIGLETKASAFSDAIWYFNTANITFEAVK
ncbi:MAG: hypothetical protein LBT55_02390 [Clostridiaceae bacterium]|jgi:hypothetical protein|nr:hypothetical protein [Clostridiaceae bacterium]